MNKNMQMQTQLGTISAKFRRATLKIDFRLQTLRTLTMDGRKLLALKLSYWCYFCWCCPFHYTAVLAITHRRVVVPRIAGLADSFDIHPTTPSSANRRHMCRSSFATDAASSSSRTIQCRGINECTFRYFVRRSRASQPPRRRALWSGVDKIICEEGWTRR